MRRLYELLGGRVRGAVPLYTHAGGASIEQARDFLAEGYRYGTYVTPAQRDAAPGRGEHAVTAAGTRG